MLLTTSGLVEVDVDALELQVRVTMVGAGRVNTVLVADDLPELGTDLVAALTTLDMNDLSHCNENNRVKVKTRLLKLKHSFHVLRANTVQIWELHTDGHQEQSRNTTKRRHKQDSVGN
jgi:hypothetical protein